MNKPRETIITSGGLIEKIMSIIRVIALNLSLINRECVNTSLISCAEKIRQAYLHTDRERLRDTLDNIEIALEAMRSLTENDSAQKIAVGMMDDESMRTLLSKETRVSFESIKEWEKNNP